MKKYSARISKLLINVLMILPMTVWAVSGVNQLPVRSFAITAPTPDNFNHFLNFINNDLSKTSVNQLFLHINYNYQFKSHPELAEKEALTEQHVKKIVKTTSQYNIEIIPIINMLGHQSWKKDNIHSLLREYPEFEENPGIKVLDKNFYTRAYCPNHPKVHAVTFALMDELIEVFDAKGLHVGMDEVFILGEEGCERCKGKNKAELFANEVNLIQSHLAQKGITMYIWGDRLLDGDTTGLGEWAASKNDTYAAIDMINKDVVICDWQYEVAPPTPGYFAIKGFNVISASFQVPSVAEFQVENMIGMRAHSNNTIKDRLRGVMHTYWGNFKSFYQCYQDNQCENDVHANAVKTFKSIYPKNQPDS
ncbi:MAG: family 20 glycosylhydrolase [Cognaticolwellia aestuarii]